MSFSTFKRFLQYIIGTSIIVESYNFSCVSHSLFSVSFFSVHSISLICSFVFHFPVIFFNNLRYFGFSYPFSAFIHGFRPFFGKLKSYCLPIPVIIFLFLIRTLLSARRMNAEESLPLVIKIEYNLIVLS